MTDPIFSPSAVCLRELGSDHFAAELVVNETAKRDAITKVLQSRHRRSPDSNGGEDKEDVFQNTAEGQDQRGGSPNLHKVNIGFIS